MPIEWVIPAVAVVLLLWAKIVHGRLIAARDVALEIWSEIDAKFRERHDLASRLLQKVEGVLGSENRSVQAVTGALRAAATAQDPEAIGKAEVALGASLGSVLAKAGAHPAFEGDAGFRRLQSKLAEMENEIEASRREFNEAVENFNHARTGFPAGFLTYVINLPPLDRLAVPKTAEAQAGRAVQRL